MSMSVKNGTQSNFVLFSLLGGAALGAIAVALTTPKTGREVRQAIKSTARRLRGNTDEIEDMDSESIEALFI